MAAASATKASMTKAWLLAGAMALTAVFSALFTPQPQPLDLARARTPLEQLFPEHFGAWQPDPAAAALVRPAFEQARRFQMYDQVLERTYIDTQGRRVMLSVAYGRQQSVGLQMHLPEVCYKAGGFRVQDVVSDEIDLGTMKLPVTRLFASMDDRPEPITYWRLLGDDVIGNATQFRLRQLSMGMTGVIRDGMLVRVSSIDADVASAHAVQTRFVREMAAAMAPAQRMRVLGHR
jgi:EpsI family protein